MTGENSAWEAYRSTFYGTVRRCGHRVFFLWRCSRLHGHGGKHERVPQNAVQGGWEWNR